MTVTDLLFDNDGVLVDTEEIFFEATRDVLRDEGGELTRETFVESSLVQGRNLIAATLPDRDEAEVARLVEARNVLYAERLQEGVRPRAGVPEMLERLHGKRRMGIVTSARREHFEQIHRDTNLLRFFDFVLTREDYGQAKPHPEPYRAGLSRLGSPPERCVAIEDSVRGVASAHAAGLRVIALESELTRGGSFDRAWRILECPTHVADVVIEADSEHASDRATRT